MVEQNVDEVISLEETQDEQQLDAEELAQELAMARGYFDGPIPADIVAPPGLSPKRAELARFVEWHRRTVAEAFEDGKTSSRLFLVCDAKKFR